MRPWTIPILGALALSFAAPSMANARPRFGPATLLGAMAAPLTAMFGGSRHSFRHHHHHRNAARASNTQRGDDDGRSERRSMAGAPAAPRASVFWPDAESDLVEYLLFPKGRDERFWAYGYGAIVDAAFAGSDAGDARAPHSRRVANGDNGAALPKEPELSADHCDSGATAGDPDALIARIERAIGPSASQRDVLEELRPALAQAAQRVKAACPAATPATLAQRLAAIQDRIWTMRDALLTIRLPLEKFYGSLTDEQQWRLHRDQPNVRDPAKPADRRGEMCAEGATPTTDDLMHGIEPAVRPAEPQRASFEALRLQSTAMAQLIAGSCPTYPLLGDMDRFAAAADRLDVMLFAIMTVSPTLQNFYDSLDDRQRDGLSRVMRQFRRSAGAAGDGA